LPRLWIVIRTRASTTSRPFFVVARRVNFRRRFEKLTAPGGVVLRQSIEPSGLTITGAAAALGVRLNTLSELVSGKRGISPEMAVSLSKGFRWHKRRLACATVRERVLPDTVNGMASSIRTLWQGIQNKDNIYIHPNDKPIIDLFPNAFNCHFPPPAFIGDVENARVILLMNAGGYDSSATHDAIASFLKLV
jgi:addiction module HigA family antidote